jgi:hypothetical protein
MVAKTEQLFGWGMWVSFWWCAIGLRGIMIDITKTKKQKKIWRIPLIKLRNKIKDFWISYIVS